MLDVFIKYHEQFLLLKRYPFFMSHLCLILCLEEICVELL